MLRHLKRRQQELENVEQASNSSADCLASSPEAGHNKAMPLAASDNQASNRMKQQKQAPVTNTKQQKRVRGRRSSKPAMEKRRRARINECLNILKSYVLNDSTNLSRLGIDSGASENQIDEETVACHILKSSGLINRHRGRKNPNKLEKADILELTVDYVRRLHEQRNDILLASQQANPVAINMVTTRQPSLDNCEPSFGQQIVPAHLSEPLTLDLSPKSRQFGQTNTNSTPPMLQAYVPPPNTPITPPSSASSLQGAADAAESSFHKQQQQHHLAQMQLLSQVLEGHYKLYPDWATLSQIRD